MMVWPLRAVAKPDADDIKKWWFVGKGLQIVFHKEPNFIKPVFCICRGHQGCICSTIGICHPFGQTLLPVSGPKFNLEARRWKPGRCVEYVCCQSCHDVLSDSGRTKRPGNLVEPTLYGQNAGTCCLAALKCFMSRSGISQSKFLMNRYRDAA